jgi:hypothetical protein
MYKEAPEVILFSQRLPLWADSLAKVGLELQVVPVVPVGVDQQTPLRVMAQLDKDIPVEPEVRQVTERTVMVEMGLHQLLQDLL